jgi:2-polyprenyl-3-methyl-5-hydroxy-6-metoxy-1,4-benzoquinol methylase
MRPNFIERLEELDPDAPPYFKGAYSSNPHRWYYRALIKALDAGGIDKEARILDLGCGYGTIGLELAELGYSNYYGVDVSDPG